MSELTPVILPGAPTPRAFLRGRSERQDRLIDALLQLEEAGGFQTPNSVPATAPLNEFQLTTGGGGGAERDADRIEARELRQAERDQAREARQLEAEHREDDRRDEANERVGGDPGRNDRGELDLFKAGIEGEEPATPRLDELEDENRFLDQEPEEVDTPRLDRLEEVQELGDLMFASALPEMKGKDDCPKDYEHPLDVPAPRKGPRQTVPRTPWVVSIPADYQGTPYDVMSDGKTWKAINQVNGRVFHADSFDGEFTSEQEPGTSLYFQATST